MYRNFIFVCSYKSECLVFNFLRQTLPPLFELPAETVAELPATELVLTECFVVVVACCGTRVSTSVPPEDAKVTVTSCVTVLVVFGPEVPVTAIVVGPSCDEDDDEDDVVESK